MATKYQIASILPFSVPWTESAVIVNIVNSLLIDRAHAHTHIDPWMSFKGLEVWLQKLFEPESLRQANQ